MKRKRNPARAITKKVAKILRVKLTVEELDMLSASIAFDTGALYDHVASDETGPAESKCEEFFNSIDELGN